MVFSSVLFTFYFLPLVLLLYYVAKDKYRNYILLIASLLFYAYGEPFFVFVMIASVAFNYLIAMLIDRFSGGIRAKLFFIADIVMNLGLLFVYKYLGFVITSVNEAFGTAIPEVDITLPIGISFFTFQALSYVIDVYRGDVKVQKNPLYVALYISFFPQLIAGPIVRYSTIEDQIMDRSFEAEKFSEGARRFMLGFCKKVIIANNLSMVVQSAFSTDPTRTNALLLWMGSICFSLQIYYDFSGYSDMALGLGKMFGFEFEENFNYPYVSRSITDFWRRWHISLSSWFRDYVYIPLGGSKVSVLKHIFNLFIVWILTGIWHGANYTFIVWGMGYFVLLVIEKYLIKPDKRKNIVFRVIWMIITLFIVNLGWVIFNSESIEFGWDYIRSMMGMHGNLFSPDWAVIYNWNEYGFFMIVAVIFSTPIAKVIREKIISSRAYRLFSIAEPLVYAIVFLWAVSFLILGAHNPFLYFNF